MSPSKSRSGGTSGRVEISDIRAKLEQIRGDADTKVEAARAKLVPVVGAGALVALILAFWLGKCRGRRKATWVEIRRL